MTPRPRLASRSRVREGWRLRGHGEAMAHGQFRRQRAGDQGHVHGRGGVTVIRCGAGDAQTRLEGVKAVHGLTGCATGGELVRIAQGRRVASQQIRVQIDDDPGRRQIQMLSIGIGDAPGDDVPFDRFVGEALCPGESLRKAARRGGHAGRVAGLAEHGQSLAAVQQRQLLAGELGEVVPGGSDGLVPFTPDNGLAAVGVVQFQNRGLGEDIRGAQAERMVGVALDLDRPPVETRHQDAAGGAGQLQRGGEPLGRSRGGILRTLYEGDDLLLGPAAAGQGRHGDRC
jgi:hypothetical protein